jgi:hypothetical protein
LGRLAEIDPQACVDAARRRFAPGVMAEGYERLYAEVLRRSGADHQLVTRPTRSR